MTPDALANDSELNAIRTHLQLAQKYRNTTETSRQHLESARDLLRQRLGNEVISAEPLPPNLQPQFDRISEQQLYRAICEALKR
jgi:trimethylamine:corrinoid methyltransferase-like protein